MALSIGLIALWGLAPAAEPSVSLRVDRTTVQLNSPFRIVIETNGDNVETPAIPDVEGLSINKRPNTTFRTQVSIVNLTQSMIRVREFEYVARATRSGKIRIPPIDVRVDGVALSTEPVELRVVEVPGPKRSDGTRPARENRPSESSSDQSGTELTWEQVAFITTSVDKDDVYQGEPVLLRLQLCRIPSVDVRPRRGADTSSPDTKGFYVKELEPRVRHEDHNGWTYEVTEYQQCLYPTIAGELTIGAWHWEGMGEALTRFGWQRHSFVLDAPPIPVTVRPLPKAPPDFSGAVGQFVLEAELNRPDTIQGTPITLTLMLTGQGNPDAIGDPVLPSIEGAYVSDPQKETQLLGDGLSVDKKVVYSITPLEAGEMTIPEVTFCYFDPGPAAYKTLRQGPFSVRVLASRESDRRVLLGATIPSEDGSVNVIGEDIRPIQTNAGTLRPSRATTPADAGLVAAPAIAYVGLALWMRRRRRFERDTGFARDYHARTKCRKRLKVVEQSAAPGEDLYRAVIGFVADKCNVTEAGMTSADARELCRANGVDAELTATLTKILRACERARYAGVKLSGDEVHALTRAALSTVSQLDTALKEAGKGGPGKGERA